MWSAKVLVSPKTYLHRALNLLYPIECSVDTRTSPDSKEAVDLLGTAEVILMLVLCLVSVMKIVIFCLMMRGTLEMRRA